MMLSSYLDASCVLEEPSNRQFALKSLDRLLSLNLRQGEGMYHFYDGQPRLKDQLADQIQTASALIRAYECTGEKTHLAQAKELVDLASKKLYDADRGGFFDTTPDPNAPGFLKQPVKPLEENSSAARTLLKLYHLTSNEAYRKMAEEALKCFTDAYLSFGFMAAEYALAVDAYLNEPTMIRIVGSKERDETQALLLESGRIYEPRKIIQALDPDTDAKEIADRGFSSQGPATAYICVGTTCTAPITQPNEIAPSMQRMLAAQAKN
jgi:uncharacterized protein YyaL (SSP411 family)